MMSMRWSDAEFLLLYTDLRRADIDPEAFAIALAIRNIGALIASGGNNVGRPSDDSAVHPHHLERFLARAVTRRWKDKRLAQEWHRLQLLLPQIHEAWERGRTLFQDALEQARDNDEFMEDFSMIDFAVDAYAYLSASHAYPDNPALRNWAINGYMVLWRKHFLGANEASSE